MSYTIRAVLADDEAPLRNHLKALLAECWPELVIAGEAGNGLEALQLIETLHPDIAFLDIKMPSPNGLDVAREVAGQCHLVFVTAYDEFALQAFEAEAVDYLLKPVIRERLMPCIERLQKRIGQPAPDLQKLIDLLKAPLSEGYTQWIRASCQDEVHVIATADVLYFQSADKYTTVFTAEREYIVRTSLKELESRLDPAQFWRIHRSTLVSVQQIASSKKSTLGMTSVFLRDNETTLPVSRAYQHLFKAE
ncbi:MAG: LytTR family DNA-binding domain-containing protein [Granulosicoccus sp.]